MENFVREEFSEPVISYAEPQNFVRNFDVRQNSMENPRNSPKIELSRERKRADNHNAKRCTCDGPVRCQRGRWARLSSRSPRLPRSGVCVGVCVCGRGCVCVDVWVGVSVRVCVCLWVCEYVCVGGWVGEMCAQTGLCTPTNGFPMFSNFQAGGGGGN